MGEDVHLKVLNNGVNTLHEIIGDIFTDSESNCFPLCLKFFGVPDSQDCISL